MCILVFIVHCAALRCIIDDISDMPERLDDHLATMARQDTTSVLVPHNKAQHGNFVKVRRGSTVRTHPHSSETVKKNQVEKHRRGGDGNRASLRVFGKLDVGQTHSTAPLQCHRNRVGPLSPRGAGRWAEWAQKIGVIEKSNGKKPPRQRT